MKRMRVNLLTNKLIPEFGFFEFISIEFVFTETEGIDGIAQVAQGVSQHARIVLGARERRSDDVIVGSRSDGGDADAVASGL